MSPAVVSPKKETYFQGQRILTLPGRTITFVDPVKWNEKIQQTLPVLATDEEFIERETYLNILQNACNCCDEIEECFLKSGIREAVVHFVSICRESSACSLWTRIQTLCDALRAVLVEAISATGDEFVWLDEAVFGTASTDACPPKKDEHWAYLIPGHDPALTRMGLTMRMDDIISMATESMHGMPRW